MADREMNAIPFLENVSSMADQEMNAIPFLENVSYMSLGDSESVSLLSLSDTVDQETNAMLSESISLHEEEFEDDSDLHATGDMLAITGSCSEAAACSSIATISEYDSSQTSVASVSGEHGHSILPTLDDAANNQPVHFCKCQPTEISQPASYVASCQEILCDFAHLKESVSTESALPLSLGTHTLSTDINMTDAATSDACTFSSKQNFHSQAVADSQNATFVTDKATSNVEETVRRSVETEVISSPSRTAMMMDQAKPPAVISAPEAQSVKCPVVQSSHSARQIKCRKTGHRRITANGANLSLGQLINAVSESCLTDGLDSTYIPGSPVSGRSGAVEQRIMTPVKGADVADSCVNENLSGHFDSESVCSTGSPSSSTTKAQGSPQVVDGVRRPPRARKSCHSNDLPKEPSTPAGSSFGTVCLAELVDAQSLDKLDVRSFDELLLAKMRERMRPSNGYKLLLNNNNNNEHSQVRAAEESTSGNLNGSVQGLDSGTPLIPSPAKTAGLNNGELAQHHERQVVYQSTAKLTSSQGESGRKQIWRCRKSNSSSGSKLNGMAKLSEEKDSSSDVTAEAPQTTRRSPRCVKRSPGWQHLDEVRQRYC